RPHIHNVNTRRVLRRRRRQQPTDAEIDEIGGPACEYVGNRRNPLGRLEDGELVDYDDPNDDDLEVSFMDNNVDDRFIDYLSVDLGNGIRRLRLALQRTFTSISFIAPIIAGKMSNFQPRLQTLAQLIPPLTPDMHKGECGRVAAIGGCEEYTGAPYFVASASLRLGTDIAYVICEKDAGPVIKSYTPDLIVNPYLRSTDNQKDRSLSEIQQKIDSLLSKLHAVSVGSGLGNDENIRASVKLAIEAARKRQLPLVLDADALAIVGQYPQIISGYTNAVLTPNPPEFSRLCKSLDVSLDQCPLDEAAKSVARKLGGLTLLIKGKKDIITNGSR
ncbi:hypothetical protein H4R22_005248, partial [Coemansia sp. RSA 1290]